MAALIIQTNEDGTFAISAPAQIPPELMADAEQVSSLDEAAQVVKDVLGADPTDPNSQEGGEAPAQAAGAEAQEPPLQGAEPSNEEDQMQAGWNRAKKGY